LSLDNDSRGMTRKVTSSVAWTSTLHVIGLGVNLICTAVLARLIIPADFGVMAGAMIFLAFAQMVLQSGIAPTIVQKRNLTAKDLRGGFTLVVILAGIVFGILELSAPFAAQFLRLEAVEPVLRVLGIVVLFDALSLIAESMLVRRLEVRRVMLIEIGGAAIGSGIVGIWLAYLGWGFWALVAAKLVDSAFKGLALLSIVRPPLVPHLGWEVMRSLVQRSAGFSLRRLLNFVATNADNAIVGRYFDAASLGLYSRAYHLMSLPSGLYDSIANRVVFPAMARVQDEPARLKVAFLRGVSLTALLGLPLCASLIVLAGDVVRLLLGIQWLGVVPIFLVMAASMYLRLGAKVSSSLLNATGSVLTLVTIQGLYASSVIAACLLAYPHGLLVVAGAVTGAILFHFCLISLAGCRRAVVSIGEFASAHVPGALLAILMGLATWGSAAPWWHEGYEGFGPIASAGLTVAVIALILAALRPRILLGKDGVEFIVGMVSLFASRLAPSHRAG